MCWWKLDRLVYGFVGFSIYSANECKKVSIIEAIKSRVAVV